MKAFWSEVKTLLLNSFRKAFFLKELSTSQQQAVKNLMKKDRNKSHIKNWRPISLLNIDVILNLKVLVQRIKKLPSLISSNQKPDVKKKIYKSRMKTNI